MAKTVHILSGDALAYSLEQCGITGEVIVCRECLIEGPLDGETLDEFLAVRARFMRDTYNAADYPKMAGSEFKKIPLIPAGSEVNLWFGNDLFCQANMWFVADLIAEGVKVFRVFPYEKGSALMDFGSGECDDLNKSLETRVEFSGSDLQLARTLWQAYKVGDNDRLSEVSKTDSACFSGLEAACSAHIERFGDDPRPQRVLREIIAEGKTEFGEVFKEFGKREAIYGFGDSQVRRILDEMKAL